METQTTGSIEAHTTRLQDGRDHGKDKATEQPVAPSAMETAILKSDNGVLHDEPDRIGNITNSKLNAHTDLLVDAGPGSADHALSLKSDNASEGLVQQQQQTQDEGDPARSIHSINIPQTVDPHQAIDDSTKPELDPEEVRGSKTYPFMEDFPNGEWWTRLDEEDGLSRSLDFGSDGYTASLNMGHELLQITAPDSRYGIVHARGSYADNPDAILARAQRSTGGKSTFGLKWLGGNQHTYRRTRIEYHGLLNFRWPYKRHTLYCPGTTLGTVSSLSFVKDEMVYQILRFEPGKPIPPPPPPIVPGSERLASRAPPPPPPPFLPKPWPPATSGLPPKPWDYNVEIKIGGVVRLNPNPYSGGDSTHAVEYKDKAMSYLQDKVMSDLVPHEVLRLNFELFINGQKEELSLESLPPRSDSGEVDMVVDKAFRLDPGKPTVIVGRTALGSAFHSSFNNPLPTNDELAEYLGATATSENATDRVWGSRIDLNADIDDDDFCTSAACLEQIMGVTSVPMRRYWKIPPRRPSSGHSSNTSVGHEAETSQKVDKVDRPSSGENIVETRLDNIEKGDKDTEAPSGDRDLKDTSKAPEFTISDSQKLSANGESTALTSKTRVIAEIEPHIAGSNGPIFSSTSNFTENAFVVNQTRVDPAQSPVPEADLASLNNVSSRALSERGMGNDIASLDLSSSPPEGKLLAMGDPNMGIALLAGILCNQWVDVQRSFWQIRYLVKAYHFLATRESRSDGPPEVHRSSSTLEESTSFEKVRTSYLNRIKFHIHHSLVWIARAPLPSGYHVRPSVTPYSENKTALDIEDSDDDRALYPPIVIWYVIKNCPEALPPVFMTTLADCLQQLVSQEYGDVDITSNDHEPKLAILLWYRHSCLAQISQHLRTLPAFGEASSDTNLESTVTLPSVAEITGLMSKAHAWQKKAEKAMASSRRAAVDSYSDQDESADRLTFLGIELGLVKEQEMKRSSSCLSQARRRIIDRKPTLSLNPGAPLFGQDGSVRVSTSAPWELTCVNHHIRLQLWRDPDLEDGLYSARKNCLRYTSTNFLFIGSWDTSKPSVTASFWDLDASCMICATFLDMRTREENLELLLDSAAPESPGMNQPHISRRRPSIAVPTEVPNEGFAADPGKIRIEPHGRRDIWDDNVVELLRKQLEKQDTLIQALTKQSDNAFTFDWTRCEPPVPFHPATWVQSLDDTPELFRFTETRRVHLRSELEKYLSGSSVIVYNQRPDGVVDPTPDWTAGNISQRFEADELLFISTYDIGLKDGAYCERQVIGRLEPLRNILVDGQNKFGFEFHNFFGYGQIDTRLGMWAAYLDNHLGDAPEFRELPDSIKRKYNELSPWIKGAIVTEETCQATKAQIREKLLTRLSDSLVDCDTHNRIFFIQRCSPSTVKAFIYLWHPQSIDTFNDHLRNTSTFSDSKSDTWTTSITISYWGFKVKGGANEELFKEPRDTAPFPPKMVSRWHRFKVKKGKKNSKAGVPTESPARYIVEGSSSLVISGDKAGRWWTCSVISSVLPEAVMRQAMEDSTTTLTEFIHQPSSGRCLVFLSFLGALCEHLSLEYERILDELTRAINLGREVLKKGLDWTHAEDAIQRLKSMLWALEALRIFDDRLGESLDMVREARDKMRTYLSHGPGRRHDQLERQCQILLEEFDKKHGRLISVHIKIEQKINQISRYREGISAVSNLEDTHTALKQNDTIRILTYITIAYLPLSFIATVFSMSIVTDSNWGPNLFGGLIVIFFISTLVLAKSLGLIIRSWDGLVKIIRTKLGMHDPLDLEDMMDLAEEQMEKEKVDSVSESEGEGGSSTSVQRKKGPMAFVRNLRPRKKGSRKASVDSSLP